MPEISWFGQSYLGRKVSFKKPEPSVWVLKELISESDYIDEEEDESEEEGSRVEESGEEDGPVSQSVAKAVFICARMDGDKVTGKEAIIKIHMQVPHYDTESQRASERAEQATKVHHPVTESELYALQHLTRAGCSSAPTLLSWKQTKQGKRGWVPGGYVVYFLMNKLPGIQIDQIEDLSLQERNELRTAFKKAWSECRDCGFVSLDTTFRNLLWDRQSQKCYIVDFEIWSRSGANRSWRDGIYNDWSLTVYHGSHDYRP